MEKFTTLKVGQEFYSTSTITQKEVEDYLNFSRIKNILLDYNSGKNSKKMISGRAILSRMEGEFTRLRQIYGNSIIFYGTDGDQSWENRNSRFLKPLYTDEILKIKFTISDKKDMDDEFGIIGVDFEGKNEKDEIVAISKRNLYRIKKEPQKNQ